MQDIPLNFRNEASASAAASPAITRDTRITVTGILHREDGKAVCVMVEDEGRYVEIRMPAGTVLSSKGYTDGEIQEVISCLNENLDDIMSAARTIDPMKAFMS